MESNKKRAGIFYGWWILVVCFVISMYTSGAVYYGFTAFFDPIVREFGWSHTDISWAASLKGAETGLIAPIVGFLVDRFGARPVLFGGGVVAGIGLLAMGRIDSVPMLYLTIFLASAGVSACGQTTMVAVAARWFRRKSSLVMGIIISGFGASGFVLPVVVALVDNLGWRNALYVLGAGMFVIVLPLSLLVRRSPEDYGLLPDGESLPPVSGAAASGAPAKDSSLSYKAALVTPAFWCIATALAFQHLFTQAVSTHVMPYLGSIGITRDIAGLVASGIPAVSVIGRFSFGWMGDRVSKKWLTAAGFAMLSAGLVLFFYADPNLTALLVLFVIVYSTGFGGTLTMRPALLREYFGARNIGTLLGLVSLLSTVGSLVGPPLGGYVYDMTGDYRPVWIGLAGLSALCIVIMAITPRVKSGAKAATEKA